MTDAEQSCNHEWEFVGWYNNGVLTNQIPEFQPYYMKAKCKICGEERNFTDTDVCPNCFEKMIPNGSQPMEDYSILVFYQCPHGHHTSQTYWLPIG